MAELSLGVTMGMTMMRQGGLRCLRHSRYCELTMASGC